MPTDERDTELDRLRNALAEAKTRNELVLEATNDGIWDWDLITDEVFFSRRWKAILGYDFDDIANTASAFFEMIHPDDAPRVDTAVKAHLGDRVPYVADFRMRAKDGAWRAIRARGQAVWDADGRPTRMAGTHTDITERRERERERLHTKELLRIQRETIRELGVPILQIWDGIVCLPIIGSVDSERAAQMTATLLERVANSRTQFALIDLTGAVLADGTAQHLTRTVRSLQLIGTRGILCGLSPEVAQMLVKTQVDMGDVPTYRDLGDALRACLHEAGG